MPYWNLDINAGHLHSGSIRQGHTGVCPFYVCRVYRPPLVYTRHNPSGTRTVRRRRSNR